MISPSIDGPVRSTRDQSLWGCRSAGAFVGIGPPSAAEPTAAKLRDRGELFAEAKNLFVVRIRAKKVHQVTNGTN